MTVGDRDQNPIVAIEAMMTEALADEDRAIGAIGPVLSHLLTGSRGMFFSEEVVARVRGLMKSFASVLVDSIGEGRQDSVEKQAVIADLTAELAKDQRLLRHAHALAIEYQVTERLKAHSAIDPVLTPLLQALIASDDPTVADVAMATLAAQARFIQQQSRMQLPLEELPAEQFQTVLATFANGPGASLIPSDTADRLRETYDEGATRLGLMARLTTALGPGSKAALSIAHSGVGIFLSVLAHATRQDRDLTALSLDESLLARFTLALRASDLPQRQIEEQIIRVHPHLRLPPQIELLPVDRARVLVQQPLTQGAL